MNKLPLRRIDLTRFGHRSPADYELTGHYSKWQARWSNDRMLFVEPDFSFTVTVVIAPPNEGAAMASLNSSGGP